MAMCGFGLAVYKCCKNIFLHKSKFWVILENKLMNTTCTTAGANMLPDSWLNKFYLKLEIQA